MGYKASFIIPVYNAERTIERCVESIIFGMEKNVEVILVDDCSRDNSWKICCYLSKKYQNVEAVQNDKNRGVSYTRNHGLSIAVGEYILFADSDDWVSKRYAYELLGNISKEKETICMCGFRFHDEIAGKHSTYILKSDKENNVLIHKGEFLNILNESLIQPIWNKVFTAEIIRKFNLQFDEKQSMGEDFQFVLEYMKVINCKKIEIINKPLYHYVRANNSSLMSHFGKGNYENALDRYTQLLVMDGFDWEKDKLIYDNLIGNLNHNFIYQIAHDKVNSREKKLENISLIMKDGQEKQHLRQQQLIITKEKICNMKDKMVTLIPRVMGKLERIKNDRIINETRKRFKNKNFSIISQNCIGGVFYHDMKMKFLSPTINLFFKEPDFVKFVLNLQYYMDLELEMEWDEEYPIGKLDDITIYFMHYKTCSEAKEAWERRKYRINYDNLIIMATDRNGFNDKIFEEWKKIPYKKILFSGNEKYASEQNTIVFKEYSSKMSVPDLIPKREFYKDNILINLVNQ